jgi:two-component system invasion response regulator UvrY
MDVVIKGEGTILSRKQVFVIARVETLLSASMMAELLAREPDLEIQLIEDCGQARFPHEAHPDLVVNWASGIALTPSIHAVNRNYGGAKSLLVVVNDTRLTLRYMTEMGVSGVVSVQSNYLEILTAIRTIVNRNLKYISPLLIQNFTETTKTGPWACLSAKELDVVLSMLDGKRNIEIAKELNISPKTVNSYKVRIYRKLGINNSIQLFKLHYQE